MVTLIGRRALLGGAGALLLAACTKETQAGSAGTTSSSLSMAPRSDLTLVPEPDANGLLLPEGFTSTVVATSGQPVGSTGYLWGPNPDGAGTIADPAVPGGWYLVVNHETVGQLGGGASAIRFAPDGEVVEAYRLLSDTNLNCAGGLTPWGTWLSCEEAEGGRVFECDPTVPDSGEDRPALGRLYHEAVCVDPVGEQLYLTEDRPDGLLYRFTPAAYPYLTDGVLEAAVVEDGVVTWVEVPDPLATSTIVRQQVPAATRFDGGEGIVWGETAEGPRIWFSTKGDDTIRELDPATDTLGVLFDPADDPSLRGLDNLWWDEPAALLYVAEDGDDMELIALDLEGGVRPLLQFVGHDESEITGPTMNPDRTVLHLSSQRGVGDTQTGITYALRGPFPTTPLV